MDNGSFEAKAIAAISFKAMSNKPNQKGVLKEDNLIRDVLSDNV